MHFIQRAPYLKKAKCFLCFDDKHKEKWKYNQNYKQELEYMIAIYYEDV